jgi:hypothetical protein
MGEGNEVEVEATSCHLIWLEIKIIVLFISYGVCKKTFIHAVQNISVLVCVPMTFIVVPQHFGINNVPSFRQLERCSD